MHRDLADSVLLIIAVALLSMMILAMPLGAIAFYDGELGKTYNPNSTTDKLFAFVFGLPISIPVITSFSTVFVAFWLVYMAMMMISLKMPSASIISVLRGNAKPLENPLIAVAVTFSVTFLTLNLLVSVQNYLGIPSGGLKDADQLLLFIQATLAPLREEFGFRLSIIGVFAVIAAFRSKGLQSFGCLLFPKKYLPSTRFTRRALLLLNVGSAIYFGITHLIYEPGVWQIGKVSESVVAGLALGWIYIEYGFFAAVLLHWAFNYFLSALQLYETAFGSLGLSQVATAFIGLLVIVYIANLAYATIRPDSKRNLPLQ